MLKVTEGSKELTSSYPFLAEWGDGAIVYLMLEQGVGVCVKSNDLDFVVGQLNKHINNSWKAYTSSITLENI